MTALEFYQKRLENLNQIIVVHQRRIGSLQIARAITAVPGLMLIAYGIFTREAPRITWQLGILLMVAFLAIATWQENLRWRLEWHQRRHAFIRRLIARCSRHWDELSALRSEAVTADFRTELSDDLDLFGDRSLFRWLSLAATDSGAQQIARWLSHWDDESLLVERQRAVQSLVGNREWRFRYWDASHAFRSGDSRLESIQKWTESGNLLERFPWIWQLSRIFPILATAGFFVLITAIAYGNNAAAGVGFVTLLAALLANLTLTTGYVGRIHDVFVWIGGANRELQSFSDLIQCAEQLDAPDPLLLQLKEQMRTSEGWATEAIRILRFRMLFAGLQRNPLFFIPYLLLQVLFLWDFRILEILESWRKKYGGEIPKWIDSIAQLEALASAAAVADEHVDWGYPRWSRELGRGLCIEQLAHPLIPEKARVANDLTVDNARPLLLVTGSNMAGKSTLLRAIGVNIALSRMGSPVPCRSWVSPNFDLASSIRVKDSLQDGVSFFMAELKRLKMVVDWAHERQMERGIPTLILLDEILQGTNSRERQIAVQSVLEHLTNLGSTVMASTHDLELARTPFIEESARVVHFREFFETVDGREVMRFDYKMRDGVTPTTNALKLLELVGLRQSERNLGS